MPKKDKSQDTIRSESHLVIHVIWDLIKLPYTIMLFMLRKKNAGDLINPIVTIFHFIFESKLVLLIILSNIFVYLATYNMSPETLKSYATHARDLFDFNLQPLITSSFLHKNITHLFFNMLGVFIFGRVVERALGFWRALLLYLVACIVSNIIACLFYTIIYDANPFWIGASGAVMGLVAYAVLSEPFYISYELIMPMPIMVKGWGFLIADLSGILLQKQTGIAHPVHLGGFITVFILGYLFFGQDEKQRIKRGTLLNVFSIVIIMAVYFYLEHHHSEWRRNLPPWIIGAIDF